MLSSWSTQSSRNIFVLSFSDQFHANSLDRYESNGSIYGQFSVHAFFTELFSCSVFPCDPHGLFSCSVSRISFMQSLWISMNSMDQVMLSALSR